MKSLIRNRLFNNFRYYGLTSYTGNSKLYEFFLTRYRNSQSKLKNTELENQQLFELKEKAFYMTASLVTKDFSELGAIDNFKENYPFTVI